METQSESGMERGTVIFCFCLATGTLFVKRLGVIVVKRLGELQVVRLLGELRLQMTLDHLSSILQEHPLNSKHVLQNVYVH